jgi:TolA-binding protein
MTIVLTACCLLAAGCVYYNTFFNAKKKFAEAEQQEQRLGTTGRAAPQRRAGNMAYQSAIEHFAKIIDRHPGSKWVDDAYYYIGLGYFRMGEFDKSQRAFNEIVTNHPKSQYLEEADFWIAVCRVELGERLAGRERLRRLAATAAKKKWRAEAWSRLAGLYLEDKKYDSSAIAYLTVANDFKSEEISAGARFKAGEAFTLAGEEDKALEQLYLTLQENPSNELIYATRVRMAEAYFGNDVIDSGLVLLNALAKSDLYFDSLGVVKLKIGEGLERAGRYDEAADVYTDVTEAFPKTKWSAEAFYRIGYLHQKHYFDFPAAREYYAQAKQEFARSEFAEKAIDLSVTLATIEGYQKQIADGLAELMAIDDPEGFAALQAETAAQNDSIAGADTTGGVDSTIADTTGLAAGNDFPEDVIDSSNTSDSLIAAMPPDTMLERDSTFTIDSTAAADSNMAVIREDSVLVTTLPESTAQAAVDSLQVPDDSPDLASASDSLLVTDSAATAGGLVTDLDSTAAQQMPDSLEIVAKAETAAPKPEELPYDPNHTADTTVNIDTVTVIDTTYVVDTVLVTASPMALLREIPGEPAPQMDSVATVPPGDSTDAPVAPALAAADSALDSALTSGMPEPGQPGDTLSAPDTAIVLEAVPDSTAKPVSAQVIPTADSAVAADPNAQDSPAPTAPAYAVDTTMFFDTSYVIDTTLTIALTPAAKNALAAKEKRDGIVDKLTTAYFNLAQAYHTVLGEPDSALFYYEELITGFPGSAHLPRALFASASLREDYFRDSTAAAEIYRRVLEEYGRTDYAGAAVERLGLAGTPADTGYPGAMYSRAERLLFDEDRPDSAQVLFERIVREFPQSVYAPQAAFASLVTEEKSFYGGDSTLYLKFAAYVDSFPGTPYADAAKVKMGSGLPERQKRERAVMATETKDAAFDSAMAAITAEQTDTTRAGLPRAPRPKTMGQFIYPESELGSEPWSGNVIFKILIDFTGRISDFELVGPSMRPDIDQNATVAVEQTFFDPDSIAPESLNIWYQYDVRVTPPAKQPENIFDDPAFNNQ